jgi:hypothetical protein
MQTVCALWQGECSMALMWHSCCMSCMSGRHTVNMAWQSIYLIQNTEIAQGKGTL